MSLRRYGSEQARVLTCAREKGEEDMRLEYDSKESQRRRKRKRKGCPYKVAVSRTKLGLLNDFEPRPAVARWDGGKNGDLAFTVLTKN